VFLAVAALAVVSVAALRSGWSSPPLPGRRGFATTTLTERFRVKGEQSAGVG